MLKKGTSLTFIEYSLGVEYFTWSFSHLSRRMQDFKADQSASLFVSKPRTKLLVSYTGIQIQPLYFPFGKLFFHENAFLSGEPPAQQWRVCVSPHLDPVTCANKGTPDTPKTGDEYYVSWDQKETLMKWDVRDSWTSEEAFVLLSSVPYCTTNVRRPFCIISPQSSCIALASSRMSISVLTISDLVMFIQSFQY